MTTAREPVKKEAPPLTAPAVHGGPPAARGARAAKSVSHAAARAPRAAHPPHAHAARPAPAATPPVREAPSGRYAEAIGRRKTAVARVRITAGRGRLLVNGKEVKSYFSLPRLAALAAAPLEHLKIGKDLDVSAKVSGGGIHAQAEAIRHGLAHAIVLQSPEWKPRLRAMGFMTRDSRMVERKKYGLKKARRAPQWAKR